MAERQLRPAQVAKLLGVNARTVRRWCARNEIAHVIRTGPNGKRRYYIPLDEVQRLR